MGRRVSSVNRVFLIVAFSLILPTISFAVIQNSCNQLFCISDAFGTSANESLTLCAGTSQVVKDFNIWLNAGDPLNITSGGVFNATYFDGTPYNSGTGLSNETNGGCVDLVLDGVSAPFTNSTVQLNVSLYNSTDYAASVAECGSAGCNASMITINFLSLETIDEDGSIMPNTLFMNFDNSSKSFLANGPAMTDTSGYFAEHCVGQVVGGNCVGIDPTPDNKCIVRGVPFPSEGGVPPANCTINSTASIFAYDFISSNSSEITNITPGTALRLVINKSRAVGFVMPNLYSPSPGAQSFVTLSELNVSDGDTGDLVYTGRESGGEGESRAPPFFISNNKFYTLSANFSGVGIRSYPFLAPLTGMTGADIIVPNSSVTEFSTVIGKVVNSSGVAVPNAIVYAQLYKWGGGAFGIAFINASKTDSNGRFSFKVPTTQMVTDDFGSYPYPIYQFFIVSNATSDSGVPIYFPTVDNNNNRGYFAQGSNVVLSPLKLQAGGRVDINVTLNSAALVISELSKVVTRAADLVRTAVTGKFNMLSLFSGVTIPSNIIISLLSPTSDSTVFFNMLGKNESFGGGPSQSSQVLGACSKTVSITQGAATASTCNLSVPGNLNLTVSTYSNIFNQAGQPQVEQASNFGFWFETTGIIRDSSNGNPVMYLNPDGTLLQDLIGFGSSNAANLTLPLPPGDYILELASSFEFSRFLGVRNGTAFTITSGATTNVNIVRGNSWMVQPMFPDSLTLSDNNTLFASVQAMGAPLNNSHINLTGHILFVNKSSASESVINFTFDPNGPGFGGAFNATFNGTVFGLQGGKYWLLLNASNITNGIAYSSSFLMPLNLFDFVVGLDLPGFSFGRGQDVSAQMFAFNSTGPIPANTSNIVVELVDSNGNAVSAVTSASAISNGLGTLNITMPDAVGFYELTVKVNASNKFGVSNRWFQISSFSVKISSERHEYQPTDIVNLGVQVLDASDSSPLANASIEAVVDNSNTPVTSVTDSKGKVKLSLDPASLATSGSWSFGFHNVNIKISRDNGTDVVKVETFYGFDVRGLDAFVHPDKPVYETSDDVFINMFFPPEIVIQTIEATVDGNTSVSYSGSQVDGGFWRVNLSQQPVGHHGVALTVADDQANSQKFFTGFDVNDFIINAFTDKFSYDVNELITLNISISFPNGTAIPSKDIVATLFKAQPPNDINVTHNTTTTDNTGDASTVLNASQPGFNYIEVSVDGQKQFIGLQVSSLQVSLLDGVAGSATTSYSASPGSNVTIYVNASSAGVNVPDSSSVNAVIWAFGNPLNLPSNTTTDGNSSITFQIPSDAPSQFYNLDVSVTTPSGDRGFAPPALLQVTGGTAKKLRASADKQFGNPYQQGDVVTLTSSLTFSNGTGISGENITFEVGSKSTKPQTVGTALTNSLGLAVKNFTLNSNFTDGEYFIQVYVTNNSDIKHYSGFSVSTLSITVNTSAQSYAPGDNITLNIIVINKTSNSQVNASSGSIFVFTPKGEVKKSFNTTGQLQPYAVNLSIPNETSAVGEYPIGVTMFVNKSQGSGFTLVSVKNSSAALNLTIPSITAGTAFLANITSSVSGTGSLTVFSPDAESLAYSNTSIVLTADSVMPVNVTLNNPGVYVFRAFLAGVGAEIKIANVLPSSGSTPIVWTGTSLSANATSFTSSQDVYIQSNTANATIKLLTFNNTSNTTTSFSVPLNQNSGALYYGVFNSTSSISGEYFVRLDTSSSTAIATNIFTVT